MTWNYALVCFKGKGIYYLSRANKTKVQTSSRLCSYNYYFLYLLSLHCQLRQRSSDTTMVIRIALSIKVCSRFKFELGIQTKVQLWPLIKNGSKINWSLSIFISLTKMEAEQTIIGHIFWKWNTFISMLLKNVKYSPSRIFWKGNS